jgi:hypothetical protein
VTQNGGSVHENLQVTKEQLASFVVSLLRDRRTLLDLRRSADEACATYRTLAQVALGGLHEQREKARRQEAIIRGYVTPAAGRRDWRRS